MILSCSGRKKGVRDIANNAGEDAPNPAAVILTPVAQQDFHQVEQAERPAEIEIINEPNENNGYI